MSTKQTGHSPLPWHWVESEPNDADKEYLAAADGTKVLSPIAGWTVDDLGIRTGPSSEKTRRANERQQANAELIVRAVNAYDDLVKACSEGLHALIEAQCDAANVGGEHCAEANAYNETIDKLRAAIAKAKA
jgi:hypothetical protein